MAGLRLEPQAGLLTKHPNPSTPMDERAANERGTDNRQPKYFLSSSAYCSEFDDGAVILDLRTGTYLGIDATALRYLRNCVGNWPKSAGFSPGADCTGDDATLKNLIADFLVREILTTIPTQSNSLGLHYPIAALTHIDWSMASHRIPLSHIARFLTALVRVGLHRKSQRLSRALDWIRRRQSALIRVGHLCTRDESRHLLTSFLRLRVWFYTAYRHCLFDSMVLSVFLTKNRVPCTLVVGVAVKPFAAHSWVQAGEWVLNDTAEYVQMFAPILAVGEAR